MNPLELVKLPQLMELTSGRPEIVIGLIDGAVAVDHADLAGGNIRLLPGETSGSCTSANSIACTHGTFIAGILSAKRGSPAPAICPGCTLKIRPIFLESGPLDQMPKANPEELAAAILDTIRAGAHVINLSAALTQSSVRDEHALQEALDQAARQRVLIVVAAGNQGMVGSTVITRHPWVIPVAACDGRGLPLQYSNLGHSIGRQGLSAPGSNILSLGTGGSTLTLSGTSAATPFVAGAIALLNSLFPTATAAEIKASVLRAVAGVRTSVVPPVLDASAAYQMLGRSHAAQIPQAGTPAYS
jgi:subtilisin family serine protease